MGTGGLIWFFFKSNLQHCYGTVKVEIMILFCWPVEPQLR